MKGQILIVDDDPLIIKLLEKKLTKAGFKIDSANDGQQALEKIHQFKPDIIISDIMMPHLDGYQLHRSLRQKPETAAIPFIFMSAKAAPADQLAGLRMGADEYVCKPFDFDNFIERVHEVMSRAALVNPQNNHADFSGKLNRMKLADILQLIETNIKTGELVFKNQKGKTKGKAFFKNGKLIDAQTGKLSGEEAFFELMGKKSGYFEFFSTPMEIAEKITEPTISVLLNGTRLIDEAQGLPIFISSTNCRLQIVSRDISSSLENKIGKENINVIFELVEKNAFCHQILNSQVMSKPRAASALISLLKEKILEVQKSEEKSKLQIDNLLLHEIAEVSFKGATGILEMKKNAFNAAIYFQNGDIVHATYDMTSGKKALFRIFSETGWNFTFESRPLSVDKNIQDPLDKLLIEATREMEALALVDKKILNQRVLLCTDFSDNLEFQENHDRINNIFELAKKHQYVRDILDYSPYTDLNTLKLLLNLINFKIMDLSGN